MYNDNLGIQYIYIYGWKSLDEHAPKFQPNFGYPVYANNKVITQIMELELLPTC